MAICEIDAAELLRPRGYTRAMDPQYAAVVIKGCLSDGPTRRLHDMLEHSQPADRPAVLRSFPELNAASMLAWCLVSERSPSRYIPYRLHGGQLSHGGGYSPQALLDRPQQLSVVTQGVGLRLMQGRDIPRPVDELQPDQRIGGLNHDYALDSYLMEPGDVEIAPGSTSHDTVSEGLRTWNFYFSTAPYQQL